MRQYAVQLYTLREECKKNFIGTLEEVARLGYKGIELAGSYGLSALELKEHLERLGLTVVGAHVAIEELESSIEQIIQYHRIIGNTYIICPWADMKTADDVDALATRLSAISAILRRHGMSLGYHNHDHELQVVEGEYLLNRLIRQTLGDVFCELDIFWVYRAKIDPVAYMREMKEHIRLVHLKDGTDTCMTALGEGAVNLEAVLDEADVQEIKWVIVENDKPSPSGLDDVRRSMMYLKNIRR